MLLIGPKFPANQSHFSRNSPKSKPSWCKCAIFCICWFCKVFSHGLVIIIRYIFVTWIFFFVNSLVYIISILFFYNYYSNFPFFGFCRMLQNNQKSCGSLNRQIGRNKTTKKTEHATVREMRRKLGAAFFAFNFFKSF